MCAPLLRTHLLGLLAALDAAITTCLVLLCIRVSAALPTPSLPSLRAKKQLLETSLLPELRGVSADGVERIRVGGQEVRVETGVCS